MCGQHVLEYMLQRAFPGPRAWRSRVEPGQQRQFVDDPGDDPHAILQLHDITGLIVRRMSLQPVQRKLHRLQRLAQVVADRGEEAIPGPDRAIGLVHQAHHVGGLQPALHLVPVAFVLQGFDVLRQHCNRWRRAGQECACSHAA